MNDRQQTGPTLERCARVLGVKPQQLSLVGEGANGMIVTDGSGVAYKFPKNRIALQSLKEEITHTKQLSHALSVAVPEYLEVHLEQALGEAFCSYRLLREVSLTPAIYAEHRQSLCRQLSALLREIHAIHLPAACKEPMDFAQLYREIQQYLFAQMSREERQQVSGRFEEYLSCAKASERCVVHGDLGAANILCDPKSGELTAVIDWAELSQDDPAMDYSSLTCQRSLPQCRKDLLCLDPSLQAVFSRMDFIQYTFPLQDRLYEEKVRAGILTDE